MKKTDSAEAMHLDNLMDLCVLSKSLLTELIYSEIALLFRGNLKINSFSNIMGIYEISPHTLVRS